MSRDVTVQTNKAKQEKCAIVQEMKNRKHLQRFESFRLKPCFKIGSIPNAQEVVFWSEIYWRTKSSGSLRSKFNTYF